MRTRGAPVTVEVYSDADEIELLLNGRSLGRRPVERFRDRSVISDTGRVVERLGPWGVGGVEEEDGCAGRFAQVAREALGPAARGGSSSACRVQVAGSMLSGFDRRELVLRAPIP
ncbi:DUF4982 domain-containing protein [Nonomuraea aurantiaca]|uniref:DUF4982 domain-containing protein n=1 Tax=Nonomuraea aurantiaca TaxID=2878562 RepID=UPI001CD9188D|nr:DUF4982 domain-containing protein [Nonomuraea aurantiaca]